MFDLTNDSLSQIILAIKTQSGARYCKNITLPASVFDDIAATYTKFIEAKRIVSGIRAGRHLAFFQSTKKATPKAAKKARQHATRYPLSPYGSIDCIAWLFRIKPLVLQSIAANRTKSLPLVKSERF